MARDGWNIGLLHMGHVLLILSSYREGSLSKCLNVFECLLKSFSSAVWAISCMVCV